ncbi:hypothetical protein OPT61_g5723 [Boeremia exigua]|uniref:Uncharacterized protein n=1 Tax=Boeremia exigua TaxID=749465 RepID=A0ACC2I9B5_9PLEO|nr:hypothetical protein OPT61_g5723 [Boeremia exigua]
MTQVIGPLDRRIARRKRCDRCVERRIKCVGGPPCLNCSRTSRICRTTIKGEPTALVFVHETQTNYSDNVRIHGKGTTTILPRQVSLIQDDNYRAYFFTSFLSQNEFAGISPQFRGSLSSLVHKSPELNDAINAISALHITQNVELASVAEDYHAALLAYSRSVRCLQAKIESKAIVRDPSAMWTTLLLGVFELMRDATGTNWLAHFLHGTSTMLCLQGPRMLMVSGKENEHHQTFFLSARIFEISRALIYTEPTFLAAPKWSAATEAYWIQNPLAWTPKEALFDMLSQFVDLAIRTLSFATEPQSVPQHEQYTTALSLAQEGLDLESALSTWYIAFSSWAPGDANKPDCEAETRMAQVYYYTISIYLDGIFSYHAPFTIPSAPACPTLDRIVVESYVDSILALSQSLLAGGCAGILLFFPLRVAGARAWDFRTRMDILRILNVIVQRGFAVAQSFVDDLSDLWGLQ